MRPYTDSTLTLLFFTLTLAAAIAPAVPAQEVERPSVTWSGFIKDQMTVEGDGWSITKYELDDYTWRARLTSGGETIREYADCGDFEQWMRFHVWTSEEHDRELLMVCRFSGDTDKCCFWLDVVDPSDEFRTLFHGEVDKALKVEDIDGDGWPELLTSSRQFDSFDFAIRFSYVQSPHAPLVLSYDAGSREYRVATPEYPETVMPRLESLEASYRDAYGTAKVPASIAAEEHRKIPTNFRALVNLVVGLCYAGREERGFEILAEFTDPVLFAFTEHAIRRELKEDVYYREVRQITPPRGGE